MAASPNNYALLKAIVRFKKSGSGTYVDLGNAPECELSFELDELEHFSSREGTRTLDKSVVREKKGTVRIVLDEITPENLALWALDPTYTSGAIDIFSGNSIEGSLLVTGTNEVGRQFEWELVNVTLKPSSSINLISDDWGRVELSGKVGATAGSFGTITEIVATA